MTIRPLAAADRTAWEPLWQGYLAFYKTALPAEVTDLTFARLTDGNEPMGGFVSLDESGRIVGIVHWVTHRTCWAEADNCYLQDLFVDPAIRGGGHGKALIEAVYDKAAQIGCGRVYWQTQETNAVAQVLYNKLADRSGFIVYRKAIAPA